MPYGLNPKQVLLHIARPVNMSLGLHSSSADVITLGTSLVESELKSVDQIDKANLPGPAYGVCQMERFTHDDHYRNFLSHMPVLRDKVLSHAAGFFPDGRFPDAKHMVGNLDYAFAMCRVDYRREPTKLPRWDDARGMAEYWKRVYNSGKGKGTVEKAIPHFEFAINLVRAV